MIGRRFPFRAGAVAGIVLLYGAVGGAQQLRLKDPAPFDVPKSICTLKATDVDVAVSALVNILTAKGFTIDSASTDDGQIRAKRVDPQGQNRVLMWLERDLVRPTDRFRIHFMAARYEKFFGEPELQRALIGENEFDQRFGALRSALIVRCSQ